MQNVPRFLVALYRFQNATVFNRLSSLASAVLNHMYSKAFPSKVSISILGLCNPSFNTEVKD